MDNIEHQHNVTDKIITLYKGDTSTDWIERFNDKSREERRKLIKHIHNGFFTTVVDAMNRQDTVIPLPGIGRLYIKKYRKRYLDLLRYSELSRDEAIALVKQEYHDEYIKPNKSE